MNKFTLVQSEPYLGISHPGIKTNALLYSYMYTYNSNVMKYKNIKMYVSVISTRGNSFQSPSLNTALRPIQVRSRFLNKTC